MNDTIIYLGSTSFVTKNGNVLYKVSFACHVQDNAGDKYVGYEADTCMVSQDMYAVLSKLKPNDQIQGIVIRENYRLKIYRLATK